MRIKEVIEKTGLTDRAIRLYIDEGLALPSIAESYSGRKSIEFSESDVERLKNVALLRKAGFSIAEIKSIVDDNSTAKNIVENFIKKTEKSIADETEIVEKLKGISFDEDVTIEIICKSLSETVEEKQVPREDTKLTVAEKIAKLAIIALSGVFALQATWMFATCCAAVFEVRYIKLTDNPGLIFGSSFYLVWAAISILLVTVIFRNMGKRFNRKARGSLASLILSVIASVVMLPITFLLLFCTVTPFYSQTTNPDNYLKLDSYLEEYKSDDYPSYFMSSVFEVFPERIPQSARVKPWSSQYPDTTKYFYEFTTCSDGYYGTYDIFAEWVLSADEYEKAKDELPGDFLLEQDLFFISQLENKTEMMEEYLLDSRKKKNGYKIVEKGDWIMVYYKNEVGFMNYKGVKEKSEKERHYIETNDEFEVGIWNTEEYRTSYSFLICAYNDKLRKIRYIASECCYHSTPQDGPYHLYLDW